MKHKARIAVLSASLLVVVGGAHAVRTSNETPAAKPTPSLSLSQASVTVPEAESPLDPVYLRGARLSATRGVSESGGAPGSTHTLRPEVLNAYTKAVAVAPAACSLSVSLLAAIGQVESGNLASSTITENRVVPGMLGPVLNGRGLARVPDTDDGRWDKNTSWDRALGPMQFVPASWRVVGLDLDDDGVRDPQNIFDAAGAAMVYLCADGRDLSTADDLRDAVLDYNNSPKYLDMVLAWQTVFESSDSLGLAPEPAPSAWAMRALPDGAPVAGAAATAGRGRHPAQAGPKARAGAKSTAPRPTAGSSTAATRTGSAGPGASAALPSSSSDPKPGRDPQASPTSEPKSEPTSEPEPEPTSDPAPDPVVVPPSCLPEDGASLEPGADGEVVPVPADASTSSEEDGALPDPCDLLLTAESAGASPAVD